MKIEIKQDLTLERQAFEANLLKGEKRVIVYPETGHAVRGSDFYPMAYVWLREKFGIK